MSMRRIIFYVINVPAYAGLPLARGERVQSLNAVSGWSDGAGFGSFCAGGSADKAKRFASGADQRHGLVLGFLEF
jgi:hypothetical protein